METKSPVMMVVLVQKGRLRWFVAGLTPEGERIPLLCSEEGDLSPYVGQELDEQVSFLRHRLSGVLQRGCNRLWAQTRKPVQIAVVFDERLDDHLGNLTERVAEHFVEWLTNPPMACFVSEYGFAVVETPRLLRLSGDIAPAWYNVLGQQLTGLAGLTEDASVWELSKKKTASAEVI